MFMLLRDRNGQIAPFMVLVMAVLILAIAATMIIGETGFARLRMANIGDSALISGVSAFCRGLNSIRPLHNKMLLNYISLQTALLVASPFIDKIHAYVIAAAWTALTEEQNYNLFDQACTLSDEMPKDLRASVYDTTLGGALIDEPKPFRESSEPATVMHPLGTDTCKKENLIGWNEVGRDAKGVVNYVNYPKYMQRDSRFICEYRALKFGNGGWYQNNSISYFFNKGITEARDLPGVMKIPFVPGPGPQATENAMPDYSSYFGTRLDNFPDSVDIIPMPMVVVFLYYIWAFPCPYDWWGPPCIVGVGVGVMPVPFAWIASVNFNSSFGLILNKRMPFTKLPFFSRTVYLQHTGRVNISGSVWSGYDFSIQ
ncbi:MAG: hypothetical protein NTU54_08195 [Candidatus Omnitrophica bacterium]|nr:hypothetical protein [Candidatus Omnitrophota bacterium]